jgi:beta-phosphoglucomutase family hydrolase
MRDALPLEPEHFDAVLFDLDGVLTDTARVHAEAWKRMFDGFLRSWAQGHDLPFREFAYEADYLPYVDGKPRYDGVRSFLASRGIVLPEGGPEDPPEAVTVHGLGNRKNVLVHELLAEGVEPYAGSVALVHQLHGDGIRTAVVSSSANCAAVLDAAGIADLFEARVDGVVARELGLPGKPAPDTYLEAARRLDAPAPRAVVVEDAISGVQSGRNGGFGLVIGVDREGNPEALREHGADLVVADLAELVRPERDR